MGVIIRKGIQNVSIFKHIQQYIEFIDSITKRRPKEENEEETGIALK
jgi:hypothetical protein